MSVPPAPIWNLWGHEIVGFLQLVLSAAAGTQGLRVSSWYRSPDHNRQVGGSPESQHLVGLAVDLAGDQLVRDYLRQRCTALGLVAVDEGDHLHVQRYKAGLLGPWIAATYDRVSWTP